MSARRLGVLLALALLASACGFKGDLVAPDAEPPPDKAEPAERDPVPE